MDQGYNLLSLSNPVEHWHPLHASDVEKRERQHCRPPRSVTVCHKAHSFFETFTRVK